MLWIVLALTLLLGGCQPLDVTPTLPPAPTPVSSPVPPTATPTARVFPPTSTPTGAIQPGPPPTPAACAETAGRMERIQIDSPHLPRPLQARVYLPPCYSGAAPHAYPLLLMLHGQSADAGQWQSLGLFRAADRLIAAGRITPLVIVLPQEDDNLGNPFDSGFDLALLEDLLPWLRQNYAACAERACTYLGGLSRGAAWAMYLGLSHPDVFSAIGAHSFPSFYGDDTRLPLLLRDIPPGLLPRIWMDTGARDRYLAQAKRYHELLDQNNVPHQWQVFPGEHDAAYWSAHVEDYLVWYSPPGNKIVK